MKLVWLFLILVFMSLYGLVQPQSQTPAASAAWPDSTLRLSLEVGSRLYPDWTETQDVALDEIFYLGDSAFRAVVRAFMPDFRINPKGERINVSSQLNNPAAFIEVLSDTSVADSTWAFLNFPPHFSAESFFTFKLLAIKGYSPPDTTIEEN